MNALRAMVTALRTLTILRVPGRDAESLAAALPWFPLVGLVVGGVTVGAGLGLQGLLGPAAAGAAAWGMLVAGVLVTGALHLDGVGDCADALAARGDRERALAIMKDPRTGAFGVIALVLVLLGKWALYAQLAAQSRLPWVVVACVLARTVQVQLAVRHPYARASGTAAAFVQGARGGHLALAAGLALAAVAALCGGAAWRAGAAALAAAAVGLIWGAGCRRRIGGVTGDTLGAGSELTELAVLLVAAWR